MQDIDEKKARALGLKKPLGVFVDSVFDDGPGLKAGLREKDVLIKINNEPVNSANIVQSIIAKKNPRDEIIIAIIRKNKLLKLKVILGERQYSTNKLPIAKRNKNYRFFGIEVQDVINNGGYGVVVKAVERYSPAHEAGIQVNDIILEIGDKTILSVEVFRSLVSSLKKGSVVIAKIRRTDTSFHAFIEIP
jgi:S1-C subfamily serine protease